MTPKIIQFLPSLQGGGAERVAVNLANYWSSCGFQVEFVLMERRGEFLDALDPCILIHTLDCTRVRLVASPFSRYLLQSQPDVILVHMWPLTSAAVLAWRLAGRPGKLFLCEHTSLSNHIRRDLSIPLSMASVVLRLSHPMATGVTAVSKGAANDVAILAGLSEQQVEVIHNPVVAAELPALSLQPATHDRNHLWGGCFRNHVLSVGSLKASKNHRLLLKSFADVALKLDAALVILGDGNMRATLEQDVHNLGLQGRVVMPGFHADPTPWYQAADLFVLSTDYEGFANVVAEALAFGTPVVSTDCRSGPAEILDNGRYGRLVPVGDSTALAAAMQASLLEEHDYNALRRRAQEFAVPKIADQFLAYFRSLGAQI